MEANNMKAMREALNRARRTLSRWKLDTPVSAWHEFDRATDEIDTALATPPRNCDVGTAEEQAQRFYKFCMANSSAIRGMCDSKCPCIDSGDKCHCLTKWAQMPYKSKEGSKE